MCTEKVVTRKLLTQKIPNGVDKVVECHLDTVYRVRKSLNDGPKQQKPGSGGPLFALTPNVIKSVRANIDRNPVRSITKLHQNANISVKSMRK